MDKAFHETDLGRLYLGDHFDLLPSVPDGSVDMILCDLPYGTTGYKWDKRPPLGRLWTEYRRIIKEHGAIVLTAQQPFTTQLIATARVTFRYELIWEKTVACGFLNAKKMPLRAHEDILVFYKRLPVYHPQMTAGRPYRKSSGTRKKTVFGRKLRVVANDNEGTRYPRSVLRFPNMNHGNHGHPTEKPLDLFEWLIRTYTDEGDLVLDDCVGSGTTAVAAERLGRRWLCMEMDPEFCEIARRRLQEIDSEACV